MHPMPREPKTTDTMRRAPPAAMEDDQPMSAAQAALLKRLAVEAYEPDAFRPQITSAEAQRRIDTLAAKLALLSEPPHTQ
jgi:hypothetical protein